MFLNKVKIWFATHLPDSRDLIWKSIMPKLLQNRLQWDKSFKTIHILKAQISEIQLIFYTYYMKIKILKETVKFEVKVNTKIQRMNTHANRIEVNYLLIFSK